MILFEQLLRRGNRSINPDRARFKRGHLAVEPLPTFGRIRELELNPFPVQTINDEHSKAVSHGCNHSKMTILLPCLLLISNPVLVLRPHFPPVPDKIV